MESINKIELRGRVGMINIRNVGDSRCARISLVTERYFKGKDGTATVETTWHNLTVWDRNADNLDQIRVGSYLHVAGRVRTDKYTSAEGEEKYSTEVIVSKAKVEEEDLLPRNNW